MFKKLLVTLSLFAGFCCMAAGEAPKKGGSGWASMALPIALIVVMIFLFNRANKKQQRQRQEMLDKVVKGAKVLLNSGVFGKVMEVRANEFVVEIAENVRVVVIKEGIARVEDEETNKNSEEKGLKK